MIRIQYGDVKTQLARVAGATGMASTDPRVMDYTNLAIQELMNEGDWPSLVARLQFKLNRPQIVLPSEFDRILYLTLNQTPMQMQSPWYEFFGDGPDLIGSPYNYPGQTGTDQNILLRYTGVLDKEQCYTFEEIPSDGNTYYPLIQGTVDERVNGGRPLAVIYGCDVSGNPIRSVDANDSTYRDGIQLAINGDTPPYTNQSLQTISQITGFKKPVTNGYVNLYAVSQDGSQKIFLCSYAPLDQNPEFRRYRIPGLTTGQTYYVIARCRRKYFPISSDKDFLLISNLPALLAMIQAIYYREAKDIQNYMAFKQAAVDILRKESTAYIGLQRTKPAITMSEGTGTRKDGMYIL